MSTVNLITKMSNIRQIRFVTSRHNLEKLLDADEWKTLPVACLQLNKITMKILDGIPKREQLLQKATELEKTLQSVRPTIKLKFVCM